MRLDVYHTSDYDEVREMLQNHINYAPEYAGTESNTEDIRFFEENYRSDGDRSSAYVLIDNNQQIASFMTCEKTVSSGQQVWYITNLFVRQGADVDNIAQKTVELFRVNMSEGSSLCINVHPVYKKTLEFWQQAKFQITARQTVFINADNEPLVALSYSGKTQT